MSEVNITVGNGTPFNESDDNSVLTITVTNTNDIPCAAGTDAYYYVSLNDGTTTNTYTFTVVSPGTIDGSTSKTFVVENTELGAITTSSGAIFYTAA